MKLTWEQFEKKYKPKKNKVTKRQEFNGWLYETYGDDLMQIQAYVDKYPFYVWTILDCDGCTTIANGYHHVNRMGYIITRKPFDEADSITVIDRDDEEIYTLSVVVKDDKGEIVYTSNCGLSGILSDLEEDGRVEEREVSEYEVAEWLKNNGYTYEFNEP
jgi:hypothetical protein